MKKKIIRGWLEIVFGLAIFAAGVHFTIIAGIGLAPWDCLGMGIAKHTPLNYGMAMTSVSVIILALDLFMKEKIGFGTIIDALLTGNFTNFFIEHSPFKANHLWVSILFILIGLSLMALGQFFYMRAGQGCGPRDSFLIGVGKRLSKLPIGLVEVLIFAIVLIAGYMLGGEVGLGTILTTGCCGIAMQLVFNLLHFEPRDIKHQDVLETTRKFMNGD